MKKFLLIASLVFVVLSIWSLVKDGYSSDMVFAGAFFGICALVFIYNDKMNKWSDNNRQRQIEKTYCQVQDDHFYFPKGYYHRHGFLKGKKKLPYSIIQEIRTNTWPVSVKVNNNELIFLLGLEKEKVEEAAINKEIRTVEPQDNWYLLLEEFLDTEFESDHKRRTLGKLEDAGIDNQEVEKIRKRFKNRMLMTTLFGMEWVYYGQFDILRQIWPLTEQKYWWTMEIALKENTRYNKT